MNVWTWQLQKLIWSRKVTYLKLCSSRKLHPPRSVERRQDRKKRTNISQYFLYYEPAANGSNCNAIILRKQRRIILSRGLLERGN